MSEGRLDVVGAPVSGADWDALAVELDAPPFLRREWFESWGEAFGSGAPTTLAAVRDGRTVGVLPLQGRGFLASPTNWHTPEFDVLAADAEVKVALLTAAVERARWQLELSFVDRPTAELAASLASRSGRRAATHVLERSPYLKVDGSFADYSSGLSQRALKDITRRRRRLAAQGEVSVEVHREASDEVLADFYAVERAGWKGVQGTAVATDREASQFYRSVAQWASAHGWLRVAVLRVGERPVAADFSLEHGGRHYLLKTGYDEEFRTYGPGKMLRLEMIERTFSEGLTSYEFLGSEAPWKAGWTSTVRERMRVHVFAPGARGRALELAQVQGRDAVRSLRQAADRWRGRH